MDIIWKRYDLSIKRNIKICRIKLKLIKSKKNIIIKSKTYVI